MFIDRQMIENPTHEKIDLVRRVLTEMDSNYWKQEMLFEWQWWVLLVATIVPWVIWWKVLDKTKLKDILIYGFLWMIAAVILDNMGVTLHIWDYPNQLLYLMPPLVPADLTVIPVSYMLIFQYTSKWTTYMIGSLILGGVFAFIIEPLFIKLKMLEFDEGSIGWNHFTSFIAFFIISIIIRWIHCWLMKKDAQRNYC